MSGVSLRRITSILISMVNTLTKENTWANHGASNFNVNIGGCGVWDPGGNFFPGLMDEVMIFHSALEQEDIQELMDKGYQQLLGC